METQVESGAVAQAPVRVPAPPRSDVQYFVPHVGDHIALVIKFQPILFACWMRRGQDDDDPVIPSRRRRRLFQRRVLEYGQALAYLVLDFRDFEQARELEGEHAVLARMRFHFEFGPAFQAVVRANLGVDLVTEHADGPDHQLGGPRVRAATPERAPGVTEKSSVAPPRGGHINGLERTLIHADREDAQVYSVDLGKEKRKAAVSQQIQKDPHRIVRVQPAEDGIPFLKKTDRLFKVFRVRLSGQCPEVLRRLVRKSHIDRRELLFQYRGLSESGQVSLLDRVRRNQ